MGNREQTYGFSSWPAKSAVVKGDIPVNCRLDARQGLLHMVRYAMPYPKSYEDVYQAEGDKDIRISVKVINCASYTEAKKQLMQDLLACSAYSLPRVTDQIAEGTYDVAYCAADNSARAISAVRGNAVIHIHNIGIRDMDLSPVYQAFEEEILSRTS
ncbi:hypothetical protein ABXS75_13070 [Roseburia hominis]